MGCCGKAEGVFARAAMPDHVRRLMGAGRTPLPQRPQRRAGFPATGQMQAPMPAPPPDLTLVPAPFSAVQAALAANGSPSGVQQIVHRFNLGKTAEQQAVFLSAMAGGRSSWTIWAGATAVNGSPAVAILPVANLDLADLETLRAQLSGIMVREAVLRPGAIIGISQANAAEPLALYIAPAFPIAPPPPLPPQPVVETRGWVRTGQDFAPAMHMGPPALEPATWANQVSLPAMIPIMEPPSEAGFALDRAIFTGQAPKTVAALRRQVGSPSIGTVVVIDSQQVRGTGATAVPSSLLPMGGQGVMGPIPGDPVGQHGSVEWFQRAPRRFVYAYIVRDDAAHVGTEKNVIVVPQFSTDNVVTTSPADRTSWRTKAEEAVPGSHWGQTWMIPRASIVATDIDYELGSPGKLRRV